MSLQRHASILRLVSTLTSAKADPTYRHAPLIGIAMDVALHLKDSKGEMVAGKPYIEESKVSLRNRLVWIKFDSKVFQSISQAKVHEYYLNNVVTSKTTPPAHVLVSSTSSDFVKKFRLILYYAFLRMLSPASSTLL